LTIIAENGEQRTQTISMDLLQEHEIIGHYIDEENERVLDRLRRNDSALKELTIDLWLYNIHDPEEFMYYVLLPALDAIATNSSVEILNIAADFSHYRGANDRFTRALSLNTSLKQIRIHTDDRLWGILDIIMVSPNLEALTIRYRDSPSIEEIRAMVQVLRMVSKVLSLTIEGRFVMDSDGGTAFAKAFQGNQTINTLIFMGRYTIVGNGAVSFVKALSRDHSLEAIVFDDIGFDDDSAVTIIRTLSHTPLKVLSLLPVHNQVTPNGGTRIIHTLRENEHSFIKLDLFPDDADLLWQNKIRLEIDLLTWENHLQVEKDAWVDRLLKQDAPNKELLLLALERAQKVDNERFSKAPDMLFHLIKELSDLVVRAIRDRHETSRVMGHA
jgi:hypothetical protein